MSKQSLKLEVILQAVDRATRPLRAAMAGSEGLTRALKASRDQFKALNAQQGHIETFRKLTLEAKKSEQALQGARQKAQALSQQFSASAAPTEKMARQLERAKLAVDKLSASHQKNLNAARISKETLEAAGISAGKLASHEQRLKSQIDAVTHAIGQQTAKLGHLQHK